MTATLEGRRVLVTRERPGELAALLEARGAVVVHVPLVEVVDAEGPALADALARLADFDWLVVTSAPGAERVGPAAAAAPAIRLAAVGTTTARTLAAAAGRPVDLVPAVQRAAALAAELVAAAAGSCWRILVVQADRAEAALVEGLRSGGHTVEAVTGYRTLLRPPPPGDLVGVDALVLASGSAAQAWHDAVGSATPPVVVSIGPTTTATAQRLGLKVSATATDHSLDGLVTELERTLVVRGPDRRRTGPDPDVQDSPADVPNP